MASAFDIRSGSTYRPRTMRSAVVALAAVAAAFAGAAVAQKGAVDAALAQDQAAAVQALLDDDTLSRPADIRDDEKRSRAATMVAELKAVESEARTTEAAARSSRDVVQLNCVEPKLRQLHGLVSMVEESQTRLDDAIADRSADVANHEFTKIALASQRGGTLKAELARCVGESAIYTGDTKIALEINANFRKGDPTDTPVPPLFPESPPFASKQ